MWAWTQECRLKNLLDLNIQVTALNIVIQSLKHPLHTPQHGLD